VLDWIERRLERRDLTIETIVRQETQRHVSISNAFTSLRWAASAHWGAWVERVSMMEEILRLDPLHVYPAMDFATRDMYRRRVETLSRGCGLTEREVAERVTVLAREALDAASDSNDPAVGHIGFHLIGPGREALEALLGYSPAGLEVIRSLIRRQPGLAFFGLISVGSVTLLGLLLGVAASRGASTGLLWLMAVLSILPALEFAVTTTNRTFAFLLPPAHLPKLSPTWSASPTSSPARPSCKTQPPPVPTSRSPSTIAARISL
jgi:cyclic beta-1,2-glucan synthetase